MKTKAIFLVLFAVIALSSLAQPGQLNQLDAKGKRDGKWIVYLDARWNKTDSSKAYYYRYTWYDHGVNIQPMGAGGGKDFTLESPPTDDKQTKPSVLDGEYKWYDDKGRLRYIHVLKKGEYISYKEFFPTGELNTYFDYTKSWEGQPHSWYMYVYDKSGNIKYEGYTKKNEKGKWPVMRD